MRRDSATGVDVGLDHALEGGATGLLVGLGETLLLEQVGGLLDITAGLLERALALHDAGAGALAQLLDVSGGNHWSCLPSS